ncbi:MAG: hypothetical protein AAF959_15205 [Cyanobacteria bacterium P01_D01_bin.56]
MANFVDAIDLSAHLKNILANHLGEWEDGSPRIHIVPPTPKLQGKAKADTVNLSEVECIIRRATTGEPSFLSGGQKYQEPVYRVDFINYADGTKLIQAAEILDADSQLMYAQPRAYLAANSTAKIYEQMTIFIRTARLVNQVAYTST